MKKLFAALALLSVLSFSAQNLALAQDDTAQTEASASQEADSAQSDSTAEDSLMQGQPVDPSETAEPEETSDAEEASTESLGADEGGEQKNVSIHYQIREKFIEGGVGFMSLVLAALIIGLAFAIERIISLNLATTNTKKLIADVESALNSGGQEAALNVAKSSKGPVASIFAQGLSRMSEGVEMVEKSVVSYGSVEMGKLERGMTWIGLCIALAPMLGFMGTVIGMIDAFDSIEQAGDIQPSLVAGGIKIALITTVSGLIVAVILQIFYNYLVDKIDGMVNNMENASVALVDVVVKYNADQRRE